VIYTDLVRRISPHLPTMVNEEGREEQGSLRLHDPRGGAVSLFLYCQRPAYCDRGGQSCGIIRRHKTRPRRGQTMWLGLKLKGLPSLAHIHLGAGDWACFADDQL